MVAYGQAQDANHWGRWRSRGYGNDLRAEKMDRADIVVVRSDSWNGVGDDALANVVVQHSRTEDLKRVDRTRVHGKSIGLATDQGEGGVRLVTVDGIEKARGSDVKICREHGL